MSNFFISSLITVAGIALTAFGALTFSRQRHKLAEFSRAEGVVTEHIPVSVLGEYVRSKTEAGTKMEKKYRYRLRIRFKTDAGRTIEFVPSISTRPPLYEVGEVVGVFYDPRDPKHAQINSFVHRWFATLMLIGFGLFAIAMGCLGLVMSG